MSHLNRNNNNNNNNITKLSTISSEYRVNQIQSINDNTNKTSVENESKTRKKLSLKSLNFAIEPQNSLNKILMNPNEKIVEEREIKTELKQPEEEKKEENKKVKKKKPKKKSKKGVKTEENPWTKPLRKFNKNLDSQKCIKLNNNEVNQAHPINQEASVVALEDNNNTTGLKAKPDILILKRPKLKLIKIGEAIAKFKQQKHIEDKKAGFNIAEYRKFKEKSIYARYKKKKYTKIKKSMLRYKEEKVKKQNDKIDEQNQKNTSIKNDKIEDGYETIDENETENHDHCQIKENIDVIVADKVNKVNSDLIGLDYAKVMQIIKNDVENYPIISYYKFLDIREWIHNFLRPEIDEKVRLLINKLAYMQAMKKLKEPQKAKKRIVSGIRETLRTLDTNIIDKLSKCVIIAVNIQRNPYKDGSDEKIIEIINKAKSKNIPIIFSCTRKMLGEAFTGTWGMKTSVISIINYYGSNAEDLFDELILMAIKSKIDFEEAINKI